MGCGVGHSMERMIILDKEQYSSNAEVTHPSISSATNSV